MNVRSKSMAAVAVLVSISIAVPLDVSGQGTQRAGQVSRVIPAATVARGTQQLTAAPKLPVDWNDVVRTNEAGRARVALSDGSVLNVGASSSLTITQHNPSQQQSEIELQYGRIRSNVVKQARPNAKFEVRTSMGVAGVVGTDFFLEFLNGIFQLIVFEGHVRFCNLAGVCVDVMAGQMATIRDGRQVPDAPRSATPLELTAAANATSVNETVAVTPPHHTSPWLYFGIGLLVAAPAIAIPLATRNSNNGQTRGLQSGCSNNPNC